MKDSVKYAIASALIFVLVFILALGLWSVCLINEEISLRHKLDAQRVETKAEFNRIRDRIAQNAQITNEHKSVLIKALTAYAEGHYVDGEQLLSKWSDDAFSVLPLNSYMELSEMISTDVDKFAAEQQQLLNIQKEYNDLINHFPNNLVFSATGKKPVEVIIITSDSNK